MKPLNYEAIRDNPELRQEIVRAAHRERARAVGRLIARLFAALKSRPKDARPSRWLAVRGR